MLDFLLNPNLQSKFTGKYISKKKKIICPTLLFHMNLYMYKISKKNKKELLILRLYMRTA
jgi:hypothetical protein